MSKFDVMALLGEVKKERRKALDTGLFEKLMLFDDMVADGLDGKVGKGTKTAAVYMKMAEALGCALVPGTVKGGWSCSRAGSRTVAGALLAALLATMFLV